MPLRRDAARFPVTVTATTFAGSQIYMRMVAKSGSFWSVADFAAGPRYAAHGFRGALCSGNLSAFMTSSGDLEGRPAKSLASRLLLRISKDAFPCRIRNSNTGMVGLPPVISNNSWGEGGADSAMEC